MLNNTQNHNQIEISKIDIYNKRIVFDINEYSNGNSIDTIAIKPQIFDLQEKLKETVNFYELAEQEIINQISDYEISTDEQNWKVEDRGVRVIVDNNLVNYSLSKMDDLGNIIKEKLDENAQLSDEDKFIFPEKYNTIAYFNLIEDDDAAVIQPYVEDGRIIIETKN